MRYLLLLSGFLLIYSVSYSQEVYTMSGGEIIFQSGHITQADNDVNTNLRFTMALHIGEFIHADFGNNFGLFSGIGIRNVGFITDENDIRIKYRSYTLGIPMAFKIGSFKENLYFFGGAEYEWMFNFKQKTLRDGGKYKYSSWFSSRTPALIPSVFAGFQFTGGLQVKFRYYLDNFLNHNFNGGEYSDYTLFSKTQVWYIALSYLIRNKKKNGSEVVPVEMAIQ